jgi:hypothetical protein
LNRWRISRIHIVRAREPSTARPSRRLPSVRAVLVSSLHESGRCGRRIRPPHSETHEQARFMASSSRAPISSRPHPTSARSSRLCEAPGQGRASTRAPLCVRNRSCSSAMISTRRGRSRNAVISSRINSGGILRERPRDHHLLALAIGRLVHLTCGEMASSDRGHRLLHGCNVLPDKAESAGSSAESITRR